MLWQDIKHSVVANTLCRRHNVSLMNLSQHTGGLYMARVQHYEKYGWVSVNCSGGSVYEAVSTAIAHLKRGQVK